MAGFYFDGLDRLELSLAEIAKLDEEERGKILSAGATSVRQHQQEYVRKHHHRTGGLENSIKSEIIGGVALIGPRGKVSKKGRRTVLQIVSGSGAMKRKKHHGSAAGITYPELGFLLEYGTPRMKASHWMENANEEAEDDVQSAMEAAWDEHLKKSNL